MPRCLNFIPSSATDLPVSRFRTKAILQNFAAACRLTKTYRVSASIGVLGVGDCQGDVNGRREEIF